MFALVDVNSFFASCETVFRPDIQGKPVVVLSNNDGCVIARSKEAKKLGIKMGEPYFKAKKFFEQQGVIVFSSNYVLYGDMSYRVMNVLESLAPTVEVYSIDEAFLDVTGIPNLHDYGVEIRETVKQWTHLTVGVGIAPTKTLAKLANYAAKHYEKTGGVVDLSDPNRQHRLMEITPVEEVWGVGRRIAKSLRDVGIDTVLKLAETDLALIRKNYSVVLERTVRELREESCLSLEEVAPAKQQIVCSRSFGKKITTYQDMKEAVCSYAERAAVKLRKEKCKCKHVSVFIKTSPFAEGKPYYSNVASGNLMNSSQDTRDIIAQAVENLKKIWKEGYAYHKAGVMLSDFIEEGVTQYDMFQPSANKHNSEALMKVIDTVNARNGQNTIQFGGQGIKSDWQMKRNLLSPAYTTNFLDLPWVSAK